MSSILPIVLQPVPASYALSAMTFDQLNAALCAHMQASVNTDVSFFYVGTSDPITFKTTIIYNTTQMVFKQWNSVSGKYVPITEAQYGDLTRTFLAGDNLPRGLVVCDGRLITSVPGISANQISVLNSLFGSGANLPILGPVIISPGVVEYVKVYAGAP